MERATKLILMLAALIPGMLSRRKKPILADLSATTDLGEPGQVDFIYSFGAPGGASPGLQNQRGSDPCFPGLRVYHKQDGAPFGSEWVDIVTRLGNLAYYWHSWMPSMKLDVATEVPTKTPKPCDEDETRLPNGKWTSNDLNRAASYIDSISLAMDDPWFTNATIMAGHESYIETENVAKQVRKHGWCHIGTALHPGGSVFGGKQVAHLIQHSDTLECVLTFQGTGSIQSLISNFNADAVHFCGLVDEDEKCSGWGTCKTRHPRGSFVHEGIKNRLLAIIQTDGFQSSIRPMLPLCSRVSLVGHALGGAVAEMFAACVSKAPQPGQYGYDDYKDMSWTKQAPAPAPCLTPTCEKDDQNCACFLERDGKFCDQCQNGCGPCQSFCAEGEAPTPAPSPSLCAENRASCECFAERDPTFCETCPNCDACVEYCGMKPKPTSPPAP